MDFVFFLLLNAVLFLRPEELFPELLGLRLYLITIVAATAAALPKLIGKLNPDAVRERPIVVMAVGSLAAVLASSAANGRLSDGIDFVGEFAKVLLYFALLLAVVDTPTRFRAFAGWMVAFIAGLTTVSVAHVNDWVKFPNMDPVMQGMIDPETGEHTYIPRLIGAGFFNDPNDLCLILSFGCLCCLFRAGTAGSVAARLGWLVPVVYFLYAMTLTHSRGGLLGLMGGGVAYLIARYGWKRAAPLIGLFVLAALTVFSGRQSDIKGGDTAHTRLMFWAGGFSDLFAKPLYIPVGLGLDYFIDEYQHVAHNSFVTAYVETGLIGGGLYLGLFVFAARLAHWTGTRPGASDWARQTRPFALALLGAYAAGTFSLSRNYVVATYLVLAYVCTLWEIERPADTPRQFQVSSPWLVRTAVVAVAGLVVLKYFTQFAGQAGL